MFGWRRSEKGKTLYLEKSCDDVISHCRCRNALITWPPQMDCPWCGCGWLFTCIECRMAFTFARGVLVDETLEEIGARDLRNRWKREPAAKDVIEWVGAMRILLKDVEVGREYVYLDGFFISSDAESVAFEGWAARHDLPRMPQSQARMGTDALDRSLGDIKYWRARRVARKEDGTQND
jgi:hypothetical protein